MLLVHSVRLIRILDCFNSIEACERISQENRYYSIIEDAPILLVHSNNQKGANTVSALRILITVSEKL